MSETFHASWLALREPVDHRSRAAGLGALLGEWWTATPRTGARTSVLDLGCGTGSNLRYLAPRLGGRQTWTLVDHDAPLLARVAVPEGVADVEVRTVKGDLGTTGLDAVGAAHLVTASALLDLVSEAWLASLVDACAASACAALFALSYDGTVEWGGPADPLDALAQDAVNDHQRGDKGLGPALGPEAGRAAGRLFGARGYRTWLRPSPWVLGPDDALLATALLDGWAAAAAEQRPEQADEFLRWKERRAETVAEEDFLLRVGHLDLLALPG